MTRRCILVLTVFCVLTLVAVEARRILLRPIPAAEVHRILSQAGREDAIPEGRVISHGLAALKGFALGFKKGVLGVAIVDGLASLSGISSSNTSSSISSDASKPSVSYNGTSNEICFTSRSATSDIVASGEARARDAVKFTPTSGILSESMATMDSAFPTSDILDTKAGDDASTVSNSAISSSEAEPIMSCIVLNKT